MSGGVIWCVFERFPKIVEVILQKKIAQRTGQDLFRFVHPQRMKLGIETGEESSFDQN
jgi:hypothetical protein